ncbi:MAG: hypothetical protein NZL95_09605 [Chitinophagales bacterium]|nr:hypothetical protein [Chitinophagales bacterium]MDW8428788.1 hypothetical protein [Chitinophagales bacterium]
MSKRPDEPASTHQSTDKDDAMLSELRRQIITVLWRDEMLSETELKQKVQQECGLAASVFDRLFSSMLNALLRLKVLEETTVGSRRVLRLAHRLER